MSSSKHRRLHRMTSSSYQATKAAQKYLSNRWVTFIVLSFLVGLLALVISALLYVTPSTVTDGGTGEHESLVQTETYASYKTVGLVGGRNIALSLDNGNMTISTETAAIETFIIKYNPANATLPNQAVADTYTQRAIDTLINPLNSDNCSINAFPTSTFVLKAGIWQISVSCPAYRCGSTTLRLFDVTNSVAVTHGQSHYVSISNFGSHAQINVSLDHVWTVTTTTTFQIDQYVDSIAGGVFTFGNPIAGSTGAGTPRETYSVIKLFKIDAL